MKKKNWSQILIFILSAELAGALSSLAAGNTKAIYLSLNLPLFAPPAWLFGVVWPILFLMMGYAAYLVYSSGKGEGQNGAMTLYWFQLFLNFLWPIVFFRFQLYWVSVVVILLLDVAVMLTILAFSKINKKAAWLLVPYMIWLLFATYLNIGVAVLN